MLTDNDKAEIQKLSARERQAACQQQIKRIHSAVNDGTLDRDTANDALERLTELTAEHKRDSFADFTGQKPKDEQPPAPQPARAKSVDTPQPSA